MATQRRRPPAGQLQIQAHLTRARECRVIHADGVWGGVTPTGSVQLAFFVETKKFPESVTYDLSEAGGMTEAGRRGRQDIQREVQVEVIMSMDRIRSVHRWLGEKITEVEGILAQAKEKGITLDPTLSILDSETQ